MNEEQQFEEIKMSLQLNPGGDEDETENGDENGNSNGEGS